MDFVLVIDFFARDAASDADFIVKLYERFSDRDDHTLTAVGFKSDFVDRGDSPNQVRHATGAISAGWAGGLAARPLPQGTWPDALAHTLSAFNERERSYAYIVTPPPALSVNRVLLRPTQSQQADMNLNAVAVPIGFWLGTGTIKRTEVAQVVKERVCN